MNDPSALAEQALLADQQTATGVLLLLGLAGYGLAMWVFRRRRFPHLAVWLLFGVWAALVGTVPALRQLDQANPWFYGLRGLTLGWVVASATRFGELARPRTTEQPAD